MLLTQSCQKFLVLLSFFGIIFAAEDDDSNWSYDDQSAWGGMCNTGRFQSPIALNSKSAFGGSLLTRKDLIRFINYDAPLEGPLTIVNNGHTVNLVLTVPTNGNRASIKSNLLHSKYETQSVHFHWGSDNSRGSEHSINGRRYDVEMHIVHKNVLYETMDEAVKHRNGLAVIGVMLNGDNKANKTYPGLENILDTLPQLESYNSEATINGKLKVGQLLGNLNKKRLFTYEGSLTTPNCSEAVMWYVFPDPLLFPKQTIEKFYKIRGQNNEYLLNNYRDLQKRNGRLIIYVDK